jgi:hypothetical protein
MGFNSAIKGLMLNIMVLVITSRLGVGQEVLMPVPNIDYGFQVDDLIDLFWGCL